MDVVSVSAADLVTPLCSQVTYEGLLDDTFGIHSGRSPIEVSSLSVLSLSSVLYVLSVLCVVCVLSGVCVVWCL